MLHWQPRSGWIITPNGFLRRQIAICNASITSFDVMRSDIDQPTTMREYKSMTTARYSQPSSVETQVISLTHFSFCLLAEKFCCNKFGATGNLRLLFVVALNFLAAFTRQP